MKALFESLTRRPLRLLAVTMVVAAAGSLALTVDAAPPPDGMGGPMMMMIGGPGRMGRLLDAAGASTDQRSQIQAIMEAAHVDLRALHEAAAPLQKQMAQVFTQTTVDANAAEALRQQMLAQHDQASKRMLQAMLEVSRVLTPAQRQLIADKMAEQRAAMVQHLQHRHGAAVPPAAK
jgi:Spy/CpxP family protein refolding chaperone